jgi:hypothetical protein
LKNDEKAKQFLAGGALEKSCDGAAYLQKK